MINILYHLASLRGGMKAWRDGDLLVLAIVVLTTVIMWRERLDPITVIKEILCDCPDNVVVINPRMAAAGTRQANSRWQSAMPVQNFIRQS